MRVLVGVKRVVDYAVKVRIQPDKAGEIIVLQWKIVKFDIVDPIMPVW